MCVACCNTRDVYCSPSSADLVCCFCSAARAFLIHPTRQGGSAEGNSVISLKTQRTVSTAKGLELRYDNTPEFSRLHKFLYSAARLRSLTEFNIYSADSGVLRQHRYATRVASLLTNSDADEKEYHGVLLRYGVFVTYSLSTLRGALATFQVRKI